jgi:hypothetical protein
MCSIDRWFMWIRAGSLPAMEGDGVVSQPGHPDVPLPNDLITASQVFQMARYMMHAGPPPGPPPEAGGECSVHSRTIGERRLRRKHAAGPRCSGQSPRCRTSALWTLVEVDGQGERHERRSAREGPGVLGAPSRKLRGRFRAKPAKNRKAPLLALEFFASFAVLCGLCAKSS